MEAWSAAALPPMLCAVHLCEHLSCDAWHTYYTMLRLSMLHALTLVLSPSPPAKAAGARSSDTDRRVVVGVAGRPLGGWGTLHEWCAIY